MVKALVTGGAGFIGSHIVDRLIEAGNEVHVLDNLSSGSKSNINPKAQFHQGDIRKAETPKLIKEIAPDVIVHTAAQMSVRVSMDDPMLDIDQNVAGTVNILHACESLSKKPQIIFTSTGGAIYGDQDIFPATEDHPIRPTSVYGLSKKVGELYLDLWHRTYQIPYTVLRLANVYGPRQSPHGEAGVVAIFSQKIMKGEQPTINGDGKKTRDFVFVKDVADAAVKAVEKRSVGIFNIGTGRETTIASIFEILSKSLKSSLTPISGPDKPGEQQRSCIDCTLAGKVLGWKPSVSIEEGLALTAAWFAEYKG